MSISSLWASFDGTWRGEGSKNGVPCDEIKVTIEQTATSFQIKDASFFCGGVLFDSETKKHLINTNKIKLNSKTSGSIDSDEFMFRKSYSVAKTIQEIHVEFHAEKASWTKYFSRYLSKYLSERIYFEHRIFISGAVEDQPMYFKGTLYK